jgi:hypothetical protein
MQHPYVRSAQAGIAIAAMLFAGILINAQRGKADVSPDVALTMKAQIGMTIAPVTLNLTGRNLQLVGLGSYIVNAQADCNGCHSAGDSTQYSVGGNPYFGETPIKVNPATYLGGGNDFGPFPSATPPGAFPNIISRNLTPDQATGLPSGNTFPQFVQIIRTGLDPDLLHPTCSGAPNGRCLPLPFRGRFLQIMPWPTFRNMTDADLSAIYEYLLAVPCVVGPHDLPSRCGP